MRRKHWTILGLALGALVLGVMVGLMTVGTVAADPTPGVKIQIPRIDVGDVLGTGDWETWIQVQNVSLDDTDTGAIFLGWGEYSGLCPTNDPGVIAHYCQLIRGNALWTLRTQLDEDVKSGIIYSVSADVFQEACAASALTEGDKEAWRCWVEEWESGTCEGVGGGWADPPGAQGEKLAVTVTRYGPNDYGTFVSSTYTGISREMEGDHEYPYEYYAPYVMKGYNGLDTELTIQNSGEDCTSVWIHYKEQGTCEDVYNYHIEQLAPGEAVRVRVPCNVGQIPCFWLGSAYISAEQPLGIIVDETSFDEPCVGVDRGTLLTHRARPKEEYRDDQLLEDYKVYADLIFREWSGWDASIQVQNLSRTGQPTFVTVDFLDNSGDEILFLADWVCPTGSTTFYLPIVTDLGYEYVGAAEIESHSQVSFPGEVTPAQPIFAVVDLKRPDNPLTPEMDAQGGSYNAHPESQKEWVSEIALPFMTKDADNMWTSFIAIRNNSNCNKIKGHIWFKDETGRLLCNLEFPWLHPKHVKLIDLNNVGCLTAGYVGSAKVFVDEFEQLCDTDNDGHAENEPLMPSVIVVERGILGATLGSTPEVAANEVIAYGDVTSIYEGIPYNTNIPPCYGDIFGTVALYDYERNEVNPEANEPLVGASVWADTFDLLDPDTYTNADTTSYAGGYELTRVPAGARTVSAWKFAYYPWIELVELECGADTKQDLLLVCQSILYGFVSDEATGAPVEGAEVTLDVESLTLGRTWHVTATTNADGLWWMIVPLVGNAEDDDAPWTLTISKEGYDDWVDAYEDLDDDGVVEDGEPNTAFADDVAEFNSDHCVGVGSEGCNSGEDFCEAPNDVFTDKEYTESVTELNAYATVQGRVYCDGLVQDNDAFNPGEEQPNVLVKLLDGSGTTLYDSMYSDSNGHYQFTIGHDIYPDFDFGENLDVVASGVTEDTENYPPGNDGIDPAETIVININICP